MTRTAAKRHGIAPALARLAVAIDLLDELPGNPNVGDVSRSYERFGQRKPVVAIRSQILDPTKDPERLTVIAGNTQLRAARGLGWTHLAVLETDDDEITAKAFALADNRTAELGSQDDAALLAMLRQVELDPVLLAATGYDSAETGRLLASLDESASPPVGPSLRDRFLIPPFDVLDARSGEWMSRRRQWIDLGIRSEIGRAGTEAGRGSNTMDSSGRDGPVSTIINTRSRAQADKAKGLVIKNYSGRDPRYYEQKRAAERRLGRDLSTDDFERDHHIPPEAGRGGLSESGTSIFDPVICEMAYRWFVPAGGSVLDPFAGGSVRGLIAGMLEHPYHGIDLSATQIAANEAQAAGFVQRGLLAPTMTPSWSVGDAAKMLADVKSRSVDLVLTCPPYMGLERYSDDPADLSNMTPADFVGAYTKIWAALHRCLVDDSFAVALVGMVRDGDEQVDLRAITETAARSAGFKLRNAAVLITPIGSLAIRAAGAFTSHRTLARGYQDLLIFVKGDPRRAVARCGEVEITDLPAPVDEVDL